MIAAAAEADANADADASVDLDRVRNLHLALFKRKVLSRDGPLRPTRGFVFAACVLRVAQLERAVLFKRAPAHQSLARIVAARLSLSSKY